MKVYILIFIFSFFSQAVFSATNTDKKEDFKHSFLSCSIITSEHLTVLQLYQRGLPKQQAIESLPNITRAAKDRVKYVYDLAKKIGILNAYADINTNFARCATMVHQVKGRPAADLKEHNYYYCAGENKIRFEILLRTDEGLSIKELIPSFPRRYEATIINLYQLIKIKGTLAAFDLTANNLKACLNQIK
ncbi:MAG: hypothetical protein ACJAWS_002392 [Oleiphilaceae bacterium]|jgi:hypothetical protein